MDLWHGEDRGAIFTLAGCQYILSEVDLLRNKGLNILF